MYVLQNWTFTPGGEGAGTIEIPGVYAIEQFARITNLTRNIPLFDSEQHEATVVVTDDGVTTTVTLHQNTSFCQSSDEMQIVMFDTYSGGGGGPTTDVVVTNWPASQNINGSVSVSNFPATQPISGSVTVSNFPATQPISGSVSVTGEVEIKNDSGNPIPVTGQITAVTQPVNPTTFDAFGRQRTSEGFTLADYKSPYGIGPEMLSQTSGAGSSVTYVANQAAARLTVGTSATAYARRQSRMYHNYQPGKSQLTYASFNFVESVPNCIKRIGYFDGLQGIFFEQRGDGSLWIVERSTVTGVTVDTATAQQDWNVDKLDGTGPSGYDLDPTQVQLLLIDFQWLGVGKIRFGFATADGFQIAHEIEHANVTSTVYWTQPSLPVRAEVVNEGVLGASTYMDMICSTVIAEGGYAEVGNDYAASTGTRAIGSTGTTLPLMAIRLKNSYNGYPNRAYVRLDSVNVIAPTNNVLVQVVRVNSHTSITGGTWVSADANSAVEYNLTATGYSAGTDRIVDQFFIASGGVGGGNNVAAPITINNPAAARSGYIAQNIDSNDSMAFLVYVISQGSNANAAGVIQWREIT